jgi:hypothetical protein
MHRVYNSAFMHMLRDEDNAKYRMALKNTLEFDPQILKRYVNFMNNPDEKTAIEQFGNGDKYFGVATLLSTLPGLPMFGHGQIEGFREKYGMEYRRAKMDETTDEELVRGHERRIFPLLHRRRLFADVEQFLLYDFYAANGTVNEDVFAYSNRFENERALVIYHNKFADTRGWIKTSAAFADKNSNKLIQKSLADGLGLSHQGFVIFKDYVSGLEYIRPCRELREKGLYIELGAYQCHVFMDWRFVGDKEWKTVCEALNGAGVPSMHDKWKEMFGAGEEAVIEKKEVIEEAAKKPGGSKPKTIKRPVKKQPVAKKPAPVRKTATTKKVKAVKKSSVKQAAAKKAKPRPTGKKALKQHTAVKAAPKKKIGGRVINKKAAKPSPFRKTKPAPKKKR